MKSPLFIVTCPYITGIVVTNLFIDYMSWNPLIHLAFLVLFLVLMLLFHRLKTVYAFWCSVCFFSFFLGNTLFSMQYHKIADIDFQKHYIKGIIEERPQRKFKTYSIKIKTDDDHSILAYLQASQSSLIFASVGDSIELYTPYSLTPTYNGTGGWSSYLFYHGISATCYSTQDSWKIIRKNSKKGNIPPSYIHYPKFQNEEAIIEAMTLGDKRGLSKDLKEQFSHAGVSHVLALSGFHLTFLYLVLDFLLLGKVLGGNLKVIPRILVLVCIWTFVVFVGAPPSLVRAAIMCSVISITNILYRGTSLFNSLNIAALIMLLYNPFVLLDVGFQLSFVSMIGICMFDDRFSKLMRFVPSQYDSKKKNMNCKESNMCWKYIKKITNNIIGKVYGILFISLICNVFTMPLVAYYFGYVSLVSLLTNVLITVPSSMLLLFALVWWIVNGILFLIPSAIMSIDSVHSLQEIVSVPLKYSAWLMDRITAWTSSFGWSYVEWHPSVLGVVLCYLLIFDVWWIIRKSL